MTSAMAAAASSPPTTQADGFASPFAIASASASHPAYPHPPQFAPGSCSRIFGTFGSTLTSNALEAIASAGSERAAEDREPHQGEEYIF